MKQNKTGPLGTTSFHMEMVRSVWAAETASCPSSHPLNCLLSYYTSVTRSHLLVNSTWQSNKGDESLNTPRALIPLGFVCVLFGQLSGPWVAVFFTGFLLTVVLCSGEGRAREVIKQNALPSIGHRLCSLALARLTTWIHSYVPPMIPGGTYE